MERGTYVALDQCLCVVGIGWLESEVRLDSLNLSLDRLEAHVNCCDDMRSSMTYLHRSIEFHDGAVLLNGQSPTNSVVRLLGCEPVSTMKPEGDLLALDAEL